MDPEDSERERLQSMPGKTIAGLVIVWVVSGIGLLTNTSSLIATGTSPFSQVLGHLFNLLVLLAFSLVAFAVALRRRWARVAILAIGVLGGAASLVLAVFHDHLYTFWLAVCVMIVALLGSHGTEEWCER